VIYHEYVHFWLETNVPTVPLWLNEGLAEFYSTFESHDNVAEIGRHVESHLIWLQDHPLIPLTELFAINSDSPDYNEGRRQGTFYAQSWALTHYLLTSDAELRERFGAFLELITAERDPTEAFVEAFRIGLSAMQNKLGAYTKYGSYNLFRFKFKGDLELGQSRITPLAHEEVLFLLGDLLAHTPPIQFAAAEQHLRAALKLDAEYADAHATLGFLRSLQHDAEQAEQHFRRAVELDPDNPRSRWLYGTSLVERFIGSFDDNKIPMADETPPLLLEAREQFQRSLELSPEHPPSLAGLGKTHVFDKDPAEAVDVLTRAYEAMPSRDDLIVDLIVVTANSGDTAGARSLLDGALRRRGHAAMTRAAEAAVAQAEVREAVDRFNAGRREEAEAMLRRSAELTQDPEVRQLVLHQLGSVVAAGAAREEVELYNRAIDLANRGERAAAVALLEQLIRIASQADLRADAESILESLRRGEKHNDLAGRLNEAVALANEGRVEQAIAILQEIVAAEPGPPLDVRAKELLEALEER
jgi:tetratricopeptide (TPR) repeat protein